MNAKILKCTSLSYEFIESAVYNILDENDGCFDLNNQEGIYSAIDYINANFKAQGYTVDINIIASTFIRELAKRKEWE